MKVGLPLRRHRKLGGAITAEMHVYGVAYTVNHLNPLL